ncbi:MAG: PEGA domain-containing protein [Myxococcales bacterium]|nr:PEGA domain-containing protein [Myxococcales bacterium]MDH3844593.1 PEGA domain-containing protein [Myxococcales bacterium]
MRLVIASLCALAVTWPPVPSLGQADELPASSARWLVLPAVTDGGVERLHSDAEAVRHELTVRSREVWRADRASERFEVVGSAPAPEISQSDIDLWVERSRAAVKYLARADYKAARRELKAAQRLAEGAAAELNREAARAQQVLDTCLFMVRAYVETKNAAEARRQARECRRLVPRVEPTAFRHTPEVRDLLAEVDQEMAAEAPGILEVRSTPSDCLVRINGVEFGQTPLRDVELPVGTYRLQVECEPETRGRIHRVAIESGDNTVVFDMAFERIVQTRPVLHLEYASPEASAARRMGDAAQVARVLGGANLLVVSRPSAKVVRIDLDAKGVKASSVWLATGDRGLTGDEVRRGVDALFEGRSVDFSGPHPIARASWDAELEAAAKRRAVAATSAATVAEAQIGKAGTARPRNQRIAGWSLFGAGVASIGAAVGLHVHRGTLGDELISAPSSLQAAQDWQDARIAVWTLAAVGGAATTASMPLLLPNYERTPWWGWTLGAVGLGLTGYAIYEGVTLTACPEPFVTDVTAVRACVSRGQEAGRVSLALAGAAPLLTVPLVYLFRPLRMNASALVSRQGAMFQVRRAF